MNNESINRLYNDICSRLLHVNLFNGQKDVQIAVKAYIEDVHFLDNLNKIIRKRDYSCNSVLLLCQSLMDEIAQDNIPQNWLEYVYQYALGRSFPHAVEAELKAGLESSCVLYLNILREISEFQKYDADNTWQANTRYNFCLLKRKPIWKTQLNIKNSLKPLTTYMYMR